MSPENVNKPEANFVKEYKETIAPPVNAECSFSSNREENLQNLASNVHPNDSEKQEEFLNTLVTSIESVLNEKYSIDDLWNALNKDGCNTTKIVEGILRFYKTEKDKDGNEKESEMDIGKYLKMEFPASSTPDKAREIKRSQVMEASISQLAGLLQDIKAANPNLPSLPA